MTIKKFALLLEDDKGNQYSTSIFAASRKDAANVVSNILGKTIVKIEENVQE